MAKTTKNYDIFFGAQKFELKIEQNSGGGAYTISFSEDNTYIPKTPLRSHRAQLAVEKRANSASSNQNAIPSVQLSIQNLDLNASNEEVCREVLRAYTPAYRSFLLGAEEKAVIKVDEQPIGELRRQGESPAAFYEYLRIENFSSTTSVNGTDLLANQKKEFNFIPLRVYSSDPSTNPGLGLRIEERSGGRDQPEKIVTFQDPSPDMNTGHRDFIKQMLKRDEVKAKLEFQGGEKVNDEDGVPLVEYYGANNFTSIPNPYKIFFGSGALFSLAGTALVILTAAALLSSTLGVAGLALIGFGLIVMGVSQFDKSLNKMGIFKDQTIKPFMESLNQEAEQQAAP